MVRAAFFFFTLQGLQFCDVTVRMPTRYLSKRVPFGAKLRHCARSLLRRHDNILFAAIVYRFVDQLTISRGLWLWSLPYTSSQDAVLVVADHVCRDG
jgi:hypothetical protein